MIILASLNPNSLDNSLKLNTSEVSDHHWGLVVPKTKANPRLVERDLVVGVDGCP